MRGSLSKVCMMINSLKRIVTEKGICDQNRNAMEPNHKVTKDIILSQIDRKNV